MLGVIVGTMALFIVLSGFSGLRTFSLNFLNISDPDLKISASAGKSFTFNTETDSILTNTPGVAFYSKVIEERASFGFNNKTHIAFIKGVDSNYTKVSSIDTTVYIGSWLTNKIPMGAVVGNGIANMLSVGVFDFLEPLKIYVPKRGKGYITNPNNAINSINTQPIGVFSLTDEVDRKFTFVQLEMAQKLLNYNANQISAVEIKITDGFSKKQVMTSLENQLNTNFKIETREQLNAVFYKMLNTENLASYLIFTLILIIALFNVVGAIIMMILDKRDNLKTLFSIGASLKEIKQIFVLQGFLLTLIGLAIGLALGVFLVLLQLKFKLFMITPNLPYPVEFTVTNVLAVIATISILGFLASQIASSRISQKLVY